MTTIPQEPAASTPIAEPAVPPLERAPRARGLAAAIATFLGGYLVLSSFTGVLSSALMGILTPGRGPAYEPPLVAFLVRGERKA